MEIFEVEVETGGGTRDGAEVEVDFEFGSVLLLFAVVRHLNDHISQDDFLKLSLFV